MSKKKQILLYVRNTVISVVSLAVLLVGGGVAYTWYVGQDEAANSTAIAAPVDPIPSAPVIKAPKPGANVPVSAAVRMISSPVAPGENASITVNTLPGVDCSVEVKYNEVKSTDSGLKLKKADEYGNVSWTWTVEEYVPVGTWPVNVTCVSKDKSAVVRGDLVVKTK